MSLIKDQAEELRRTFDYTKTRIVLVTGGKGGVGKSIIAVNLAVKLSENGQRVLIFDADAGFANASILLGVPPRLSMKDYFENKVTLMDCVQKTEYNVNLLSTGMDIKDWIAFQKSFTRKSVEDFFHVARIHDFVIIDVGAGYNENLKPFYISADNILLVTMPEPTAIVNAYTMIKAFSMLQVEGAIDVILNMVRRNAEAESAEIALRRTVKDYLSKDIRNIFYVNFDNIVHESVKSQRPIVVYKPNSDISKSIELITEAVLNDHKVNLKTPSKSLFRKVLSLFGF